MPAPTDLAHGSTCEHQMPVTTLRCESCMVHLCRSMEGLGDLKSALRSRGGTEAQRRRGGGVAEMGFRPGPLKWAAKRP